MKYYVDSLKFNCICNDKIMQRSAGSSAKKNFQKQKFEPQCKENNNSNLPNLNIHPVYMYKKEMPEKNQKV